MELLEVQVQAPDRIVDVGVEPGRDQDQLGLEARDLVQGRAEGILVGVLVIVDGLENSGQFNSGQLRH